MSLLNKIVAYWYDCIKNEDILEKDISINVRKKAVLYPFNKDLLIFDKKEHEIPVFNSKRLVDFYNYIYTKGYESYYGYPILFYFDDETSRYSIAPLFIIKVRFFKKDSKLYLQKEEHYPTCGIKAFEKLGFKTEEIADISQLLETLFRTEINSRIELATKCLEIIQKEAEIPIRETIDPENLTNYEKFNKDYSPGLYNKSLLFAGEETNYNLSLLQDLLELKERKDLEKTALSFIIEKLPPEKKDNKIPIFPFPFNEYHVQAFQNIFQNKLSVITGPPGTGKSQFISNILINLFLKGDSVLFVSHTNEAVNVVNDKINVHFKNLLLRTGKKEFRQQLKGKFNELIIDSEQKRFTSPSLRDIQSLWKTLSLYRRKLLILDKLEREYEQLFFRFNNTNIFRRVNIWLYLKNLLSRFILDIRLNLIKNKLIRYPTKLEIESEIRRLEKEYFKISKEFVKGNYLQIIFKEERSLGRAKYFINQVDSRGLNFDKDIYSFKEAKEILRLWSSTLKPIRRTFPLKPCIFDYVIFDEASQIDLPSAAPALYRAKKAIVVGDPMQLTHVAGLTRDMDKGLAKVHGLLEEKDIYPAKIRYCDVSLYKSAERSLTHKPILLINHYRSEDQIITLCNRVFYGGKLKNFSTLDYSKYPDDLPVGVHWVDCEGEVIKHPGGSRVNKTEVELVSKIFQYIIQKISGTDLTVGIVTPYSRQQDEINRIILQSAPPEIIEKHKVKILTAHKFQGTEKDIMIFSLVLASRGNGNSDRWYNIYPQILNVALSRAKYLLLIVGEKKFCREHSCYKGNNCILKSLVENYEKIKEETEFEKHFLYERFDTPTERFLYQKLQKINFENIGYELIPKLVVKRYTLDFALLGKKKIDIECDGCHHEIVEGMPVIEDVERDEFLKKMGWEILRFPNHRILNESDKVLNEILENISVK